MNLILSDAVSMEEEPGRSQILGTIMIPHEHIKTVEMFVRE